jgi:flagellar hook assembly protein FlgD
VVAGYTINIAVYNETGEMVKQIAVTQFSQPLENIQLTPDGLISGLNDSIEVVYNGVTITSWDGTNSDGTLTSNGTYYVKVDNIDALGTVTTETKQLEVNRSLSKITVSVYNEAGEVVRHLYGVTDDPLGSTMTNVTLSSNVIDPGATGANDPNQLILVIETTGTPVTLVWDGNNDSASLVGGGRYELHVQWNNGQGSVTDITKGVLVVGARTPLGQVVAAPNLLNASSGMITTFKVNTTQSLTLRVRVYTMAGELAAKPADGTVGANSVTWDATGLASGMYLGVVEGLNPQGGLALRQIVKVVIVR